MSLIKRMRKQKAVYWARGSPDVFAQFSFLPPVEVSCRWEDTEQEFLNPQGETQVSRSVVYVDRLMSLGDRLKQGELDSDVSLDDAVEIKRFDRLPNLRASEFLMVAYLL